MKFTAVIVTRGDIDLSPCLKPIVPLADEIIIRRGHGGVWERFDAAFSAKHNIVYTQDDDCVVEVDKVMAAYEHDRVTCNMPDGPDSHRRDYSDGIALVGWGSVFHTSRLEAILRYRKKFAYDAVFLREADRVFTGLNQVKLIDVPFEHLPEAYSSDRMGAQPNHGAMLTEIRRRIGIVRREA
jgi:hypothetical protein